MNKKIILIGILLMVALAGCSQESAVRRAFMKAENALANNDFAAWESMLTTKLKEQYSNPKNILGKKTPKEVETLDDWFLFAVQSRLQLNNGKPLTPNRVKMVSETKAVVYVMLGSSAEGGKEIPQSTLVKRDGKWLLASPEEE